MYSSHIHWVQELPAVKKDVTLLDQPVTHALHFSQTFVIHSYDDFVETSVGRVFDFLNKLRFQPSFFKKGQIKEPLVLLNFVKFNTPVDFKKCFMLIAH